MGAGITFPGLTQRARNLRLVIYVRDATTEELLEEVWKFIFRFGRATYLRIILAFNAEEADDEGGIIAAHSDVKKMVKEEVKKKRGDGEGKKEDVVVEFSAVLPEEGCEVSWEWVFVVDDGPENCDWEPFR